MFEAEETPNVLVWAALENAGGARQAVLDPAVEKLITEAKADQAYQKIREAVKGGKVPRDLPTSHPAQKFQGQWDALSTTPELQGLLLYHGRIVVPEAAKTEVMKTLHVQHTGESKTLANARQLYFWVGMTQDIKLMVAACQVCLTHKPSQRLEPQIQTVASRPWEAMSIDRRSYEIDIEGRTHVRNRRFLRPAITPGPSTSHVPNEGPHPTKATAEKKIHDLRSRRKVKFRD